MFLTAFLLSIPVDFVYMRILFAIILCMVYMNCLLSVRPRACSHLNLIDLRLDLQELT